MKRTVVFAVVLGCVASASACGHGGHVTPQALVPTSATVVKSLNLEVGQPCFGNEDCATGFCDTRVDDCKGNGTCADVPQCLASNPAVTSQACGCDGHTYANECEVRRASVGLRRPGPCPAFP